jgi:hypothetical protein
MESAEVVEAQNLELVEQVPETNEELQQVAVEQQEEEKLSK